MLTAISNQRLGVRSRFFRPTQTTCRPIKVFSTKKKYTFKHFTVRIESNPSVSLFDKNILLRTVALQTAIFYQHKMPSRPAIRKLTAF